MTPVEVPSVSWPDGGIGGCWDHGIILDLLEGRYGTPPGWPTLTPTPIDNDGGGVAVVHVSGRFHCDAYDDLTAYLARWDGVLLIVTSDEEYLFDVRNVTHPNMEIWRQTPRPEDPQWGHTARGFGHGPPRRDIPHRPAGAGGRDLAWSFCGQITNERRGAWLREMTRRFVDRAETERAFLVATKEFTAGLPADAYTDVLRRSVLAPCPAGAVAQCSFRVYEALDAGAVPIADDLRNDGGGGGYWRAVFATGPPFPIVTSPRELGPTIDRVMANPDWYRTGVHAWWKREQYRMTVDLVDSLDRLGADTSTGQDVTFLVTASPIDPERQRPVLEETLQSLIEWGPDGAPIVVVFDRARPGDDDDIAAAYAGNVAHLVDQFSPEANITAVVVPEWAHQAGAARLALEEVHTRFVCFVEHDTPIVGDVPWDRIAEAIDTEHGPEVVRLFYDVAIPDEHRYLHGDVETVAGVPLLWTRQWSQRPHIAATGWYRRMLSDLFTSSDRSMIEDAVYGVYERGDREGVAIFHPDGNLQRSRHLDGRRDRVKGSMTWQGNQIA